MARRRLLSSSINVKVNIDGIEYALKTLPLNNKLNKEINGLLRDYCNPYVPFREGQLSNPANISVTPKSITYNVPYARYQYYGKVYGPNDFKGYGSGGVPKFRTPEGEEKYPTGNYLVYSRAFHPLATSEWDKAMMSDIGDEFTEAVAEIVRPVVVHQQRVASARALNW